MDISLIIQKQQSIRKQKQHHKRRIPSIGIESIGGKQRRGGGDQVPKWLLRLEGLAVLLVSLYVYALFDYSWMLFFLFILAPDLSALGFLISQRVGAISYNIFHTYLVVWPFIFIGSIWANDWLLMIGLIFASHIGMDRILGYGLRYSNTMKESHLSKL